ncbi:MAG: DEAD/DEAH box helicase, partial [Thaumarchaeota archaeon]|nr:DEAD/DEAH box helicase [Nitrososphaerota archaeon]
MELTAANFRMEAPRFIFSRLTEGKNVVIDAPPGLGKTRSAAKTAIKLVREVGQRVVIIEPTKTLRSQV